ncbi:MAG: Golgi transport complex subunit 3 [Pycnora praestabilis]|nr:MAG: Golgi transport complex subunit 3 [Pycnora praestabilis]
MYEDSWYNAFVPSPQSQKDPSQVPKHRRRESLLKQPNESTQADTNRTGGIADIVEEANGAKGPPKATAVPRAKSYSDLHRPANFNVRKDEQDDTRGCNGAKDVRTELDFQGWYDELENDLFDASHEEYHDQLDLSTSHLDSLLDSTNSSLDLLSSLSESFRAVETQTTAFQAQCQSLLSEQQRLTRLADELGKNLQYYNYLEPVTRRLNAPGAGNFVRGKEFLEMLSHLDDCLAYMQKHPGHVEAQTYRSRYRLLLTRALTLIRVHFVASLRDIATDVSKRIADRQLNDTTMSALLYAKFRVGATELKEVGQAIHKRTISSAGAEAGGETEYQSLMNELYQSYSTTRGRLVIPIVRKRMTEIAMAPSTSIDLVAFARTSISYIRGICLDEHELWRDWFQGDEKLFEFLESVCEPLYDHLRPRTIHETQLLKLCELCTLLQTRYMHDQEEDTEPLDPNQLDFSTLIQPAMEDSQTRLVFRAQAMLRNDIEYYRPRPEDLDYPRQSRTLSLSGAKAPIMSGKRGSLVAPSSEVPKPPVVVEDDGGSGDEKEPHWDIDGGRKSGTWYPTLKTAVWLLSRIYRLVNSTVFDDLAHQIVHQTTLSLHQAATLISKGKADMIDSQLFLIKHLLVLKQQIVAFDIEFVTPDVSFDFSGVTSTFWELRERGGLFNPRALMRFMGGGLLPRVVENMLDAKVELDGRLRTVINDFTSGSAAHITALIKIDVVSFRGFNADAAVRSVREVAEKEVPLLRRRLDEYLEDARTKETLIGAVQDQVVQNYKLFYEKFSTEVSGNAKAVSKKGKGREDEVWDLDTFAEWTRGVFRVGGAGMRDTNEASRSRSASRNGSM